MGFSHVAWHGPYVQKEAVLKEHRGVCIRCVCISLFFATLARVQG